MRHTTNSILALSGSPGQLVGTLLAPGGAGRIIVQRLQRVPLTHCELEGLVLFNPTTIAQQIMHWYRITNKDTPLLLALSGPAIVEKLIPLPTTHPTIDQLPIQHAPDWHWQWRYLYSIDDMHYFYLAGIRRSILFQYQLMALTHQLPLRVIMPGTMALLSLYRHKSGASYRASQLAEHLNRAGRIERLFTTDDLERLAQLPAGVTIDPQDTVPLLIACGLLTGEIYASY